MELHPITYFALVVLLFVICYYIHARLKHKTYLERQSRFNDPRIASNHPTQTFHAATPNLLTFSAGEAEQRKIPKDVDTLNVRQRNLQNHPGFGNTSVSQFETSYKEKEQPSNMSTRFSDDFKKNPSYEPSRLVHENSSVFTPGWKSDNVDRYTPNPQGSAEPENSYYPVRNPILPSGNQLNAPVHNNYSNLTTNVLQSIKEEPQLEMEKQNSVRNEDANLPINTDAEYKVFAANFKPKEGRSSQEGPKKYDSPQRIEKGTARLSRVGHSPDSPFRIFESPAVKTSSKKKHGGSKGENVKGSSGAHAASKKDSFSRTQDALYQEPRGRQDGNSSTLNQSTRSSLAKKKERKARPEQVFLNNNSDEEMAIEEKKVPQNPNKRAAGESQSIDNLEQETSKTKYLKGDDLQAKDRTQVSKKSNLNSASSLLLEDHQNKSAVSGSQKTKNRPSYDISYLSEHGSNQSLKKYIAKKTVQENSIKTTKPSSSNSLSNNVMQEEAHPQPNSQKTPPLLTGLGGSGITLKKPNVNGNGFLLTNEKPTSQIKNAPQNTSSLVQEAPIAGEPEKPKTSGFNILSNSALQAEKPTLFQQIVTTKEVKLSPFSEPEVKKDEKPGLFSQPTKSETEPPKLLGNLGGSLFSTPLKPAEAPASSSVFAKFNQSEPATSSLGLFAQPKVAETVKSTTITTSILVNKEKEPEIIEQTKKTEVIVQESVPTQKETDEKDDASNSLFAKPKASDGDIFKTMRYNPAATATTTTVTNTDEIKEKAAASQMQNPFANPTKDDKKEEEKASVFLKDQPNTVSFGVFPPPSNENKQNSDKAKEDSQTTAPKSLFTSSGTGLFSGLNNANPNNSPFGSLNKKDEKKPEQDSKPNGTTEGGLFSNLNQNSGSTPTTGAFGSFGIKTTGASPGGGLFGGLTSKTPEASTTNPPTLFGGSVKKEEAANLPAKPFSLADSISSVKRTNSSPENKEEGNKRGGLFSQPIPDMKGGSSIFGDKVSADKTDNKQPGFGFLQGGSSTFFNSGTPQANGGSPKKTETTIFGGFKPLGEQSTDKSATGLFGSRTPSGGLFQATNSASIPGAGGSTTGGLFAGYLSNKTSNPSNSGLFANLTKQDEKK